MDSIVIHNTETAQWQALVNEAQQQANLVLNEDLESYLVFLLMRYMQKPTITAAVLAIEYLESSHLQEFDRKGKLRDVGDLCLLFSGMFPHRANRKRVKISYFVDLGRTAYHQLSCTLRKHSAQIYAELAQEFVKLMDVLHVMRQMDSQQQPLTPLQALELWQDTGSQFALDSIHTHTAGLCTEGNDKIN